MWSFRSVYDSAWCRTPVDLGFPSLLSRLLYSKEEDPLPFVSSTQHLRRFCLVRVSDSQGETVAVSLRAFEVWGTGAPVLQLYCILLSYMLAFVCPSALRSASLLSVRRH